MTRQVKDFQLQFGQTPINEIRFDARSRDDIPQLLRGLQYIYITPDIRAALFSALEQVIPSTISASKGRQGMELWKIFVMGTLRVNLNWDYDRLLEMVNTHRTIRQMLGHGIYDDEVLYKLQTLKDNIRLLTPEILDTINQVIISAGHGLLKKKDQDITLSGRCDSFVVETDVHYPTDINLLYDAMRKVISLSSSLSRAMGDSDWRQHRHLLRVFKRSFRKAQKIKRASYKDRKRQIAHEEKLQAIYREHITQARRLLAKSEKTRQCFKSRGLVGVSDIATDIALENYLSHAYRQIDQIERRVLKGETIPHGEKVFSLFEPHTEWIMKGKKKAPVELGKRVCILEDQLGFILHHKVTMNEVDSDIAVLMVDETKQRFKQLKRCSFDKGFYSKENKLALTERLDQVILPKKGRLTQQEKIDQAAPDYQKYRYQHAAVESAINALEQHGLDRCLDHGLLGFERYVGLSVVARNVQQIGALLHNEKKYTRLRRKVD